MRETAPVLHLNAQQAESLGKQCEAYRKYAFQCLAPSPERNQVMRSVQALEGRLLTLLTQRQVPIVLEMTREEGSGLRSLFTILMQAYGASPSSEARIQALGELAALRTLVERALHMP